MRVKMEEMTEEEKKLDASIQDLNAQIRREFLDN
jgi:hypothetical protein